MAVVGVSTGFEYLDQRTTDTASPLVDGYKCYAETPTTNNSLEHVRTWFDGLHPADRDRSIKAAPADIAWLDGVPIAARDLANRISLDLERARVVENWS